MTLPPLDDVIAALASPPGGGARGIVRISGPDVRSPLAGLFLPDDPRRWNAARRAERHAGRIVLSNARVPLDAAAHLWPTNRSYTGAPLVELHLPGSPPLLEAVLSALHERGVRPARPGEFTLRAFLAGRIDLVQAEAVLGVIDAHDRRELETALAQLAGGLSGKIATVRGDLLDLLADLEAGLDFVDEDIEFVRRPELLERIDAAGETVTRLLEQSSRRMRSAGSWCVVLAGLPNAGKSTLFNALAGRDAALVSPTRGTTRDWLSAELDWQGTAIELIDTAGWEEVLADRDAAIPPDAEIMAAAAALRAAQFERADVVVWCTAADLDSSSRAIDADLLSRLESENRPVLHIRTRSDLAMDTAEEFRPSRPLGEPLSVSASTGRGLPELRQAVAARLSDATFGGRELVGMTASRARESLAAAAAAIARALDAATAGLGDEIIAIELRDALDHLGRILGAVHTDDILDRIFSKFCIGK